MSTREVCDVLSTLDCIQDVNVYGVKVEGINQLPLFSLFRTTVFHYEVD